MVDLDKSILRKYIKDRVYKFIFDKDGTFYPSRQSFESQLDLELIKRDLEMCGKNIRILFTMFGDRQYISLHLIGELSNSKYNLEIKEEEILQHLRSKKIESIVK